MDLITNGNNRITPKKQGSSVERDEIWRWGMDTFGSSYIHMGAACRATEGAIVLLLQGG